MDLLNGSRAQNRTDKSGELEKEREEAVLNPKEPDQVKEKDVFLICYVFKVSKFLALQAYAKPHYLALGLIVDEREDVDNAADEDLVDLEKLDPLRRALRLARKADDFNVISDRTSNLNSNYQGIKDELDAFSCSILTQCKDLKEVAPILEHKPQGTEAELKQSNLMKALWEGRKEFVAHPFFQEYFNQ